MNFSIQYFCVYGSSVWASVIALDDFERPVITWVHVLGTYLYYLGGVS